MPSLMRVHAVHRMHADPESYVRGGPNLLIFLVAGG